MAASVAHQDVDLVPADLARLVEQGEGEAYAALCLAAPVELKLKVARFGSALALVAPHYLLILLNRVIRLGVEEPATEAQVDEILALYRKSASSSFAVHLSPQARPLELADWLVQRGLERRDNWAKMVRPARPAAEISTDLRIEAIGRGQAAAFAAVTVTAFGIPSDLSLGLAATVGRTGWRHYLAYDGDLAVATAALFVCGAVGWLGEGSTLPTHRRRGAQGALMAWRINDSIALGCQWLITETGEDLPSQPNPSFHNMLRTGFRLAYRRANYVPSGTQR